MDKNTIYEQIKFILIEEFDVNERKIHEDSKLGHDLSIFGHDAIEFMDIYFKEFNIENTDSYDFHKHFEPEGFDPFGLIFLLEKIFRCQPKRQLEHDLQISDLVLIALKRSWDL